jgi:nitrile hydratase accessory protein
MADAPLDWHGPAAPPRRNGELHFTTLWESRLFGATMALFEAGTFTWNEFRHRLIEEIQARGEGDEGFDYWACWQVAFERLLAAKGILAAADLEARVRALAARPRGHDHAKPGSA